eukprot:11810994-Prorocentrum_lima.AAC.1
MQSGQKPQYHLELQNWESFRSIAQFWTMVKYQLCWACAQLKLFMASLTPGRSNAICTYATTRTTL